MVRIHGRKYRGTTSLPAWLSTVAAVFALTLDVVFCADVGGEQPVDVYFASVVTRELSSADGWSECINWWAFQFVHFPIRCSESFAVRDWLVRRHEHMLATDFGQEGHGGQERLDNSSDVLKEFYKMQTARLFRQEFERVRNGTFQDLDGWVDCVGMESDALICNADKEIMGDWMQNRVLENRQRLRQRQDDEIRKYDEPFDVHMRAMVGQPWARGHGPYVESRQPIFEATAQQHWYNTLENPEILTEEEKERSPHFGVWYCQEERQIRQQQINSEDDEFKRQTYQLFRAEVRQRLPIAAAASQVGIIPSTIMDERFSDMVSNVERELMNDWLQHRIAIWGHIYQRAVRVDLDRNSDEWRHQVGAFKMETASLFIQELRKNSNRVFISL